MQACPDIRKLLKQNNIYQNLSRLVKRLSKLNFLTEKFYKILLFFRLRKARRHMAVALVDSKLVLIGGVGRYRLKMSSVETFDLHSGSWITCENVPETFTDFPPVCTINGMVAVCLSSIYMFNPSSNRWITVKHSFDCGETASVKCLTSFKNILYLGIYNMQQFFIKKKVDHFLLKKKKNAR